MSRILIAYSTVDGQSRKICLNLQHQLESYGEDVFLHDIAASETPDLSTFDKILIGASIRYGHHRPQVCDFVKQHRALLASKPSGFFSVNLVARKPGRDAVDSNPYLRKFLRKVDWQPTHLAVFAGKLDYQRYKLTDRWMIRLIMWLTDGPTDLQASVEFTDWDKVDRFGKLIQRM